jgi:outer membrane translocation and assembly module TamA
MRVPIVSRVGGVLFADLGNVWNKEWGLRLGDLLYDAGFGLRYNSPFGPVRIDYAHQLNRVEGLRFDGKPQRRPWRVHVNFGYGF